MRTTKVLGASVRKEQIAALKQMAARHDVGVSRLLREAIDRFLRQEGVLPHDDATDELAARPLVRLGSVERRA